MPDAAGRPVDEHVAAQQVIDEGALPLILLAHEAQRALRISGGVGRLFLLSIEVVFKRWPINGF